MDVPRSPSLTSHEPRRQAQLVPGTPASRPGARNGRSSLAALRTRGLACAGATLICLYLLATLTRSAWLVGLANLVGPVTLGAVAAASAYRLIRRQPLAIWTPYAWFLGAVVLFYSLGPLVYVFGRDEVLNYLDASLPIRVGPAQLLNANLLNAVGILAVVVGFRLARFVWKGPRPAVRTAQANLARVKPVALWLLLIGGALQYFLILPWEFGVYHFVLPGVIYNLGNLILFGLAGVAYISASGHKRWALPLYLFWPPQVLIALLHFSKTSLILSLLLPVLGFYLANKSTKRLLLAGLAMGLAYVSVAQLVHYGRSEINDLAGNINHASLGERLAIFGRWLGGERQSYEFLSPFDLSPAETGWTRLSYVAVQAFAMDRYDTGLPGDTLKSAFIVLIPRIMWPSKPVTVDVAKDFYELVSGQRGDTYLGLGIFGEGYWNLGWFGVTLLGALTGVAFWVISAFAMHWMRNGEIAYMPGIFLGINMGVLGTTQFFANAIVGGCGFLAVYALVISRALHMISGRDAGAGRR